VFIANPNNNIENIVQRMCRCNRIINNKTKSNIFLWCSKNKTKKILSYLFDNVDEINNKIVRMNILNNSVIEKQFDNSLKNKHQNIFDDFDILELKNCENNEFKIKDEEATKILNIKN